MSQHRQLLQVKLRELRGVRVDGNVELHRHLTNIADEINRLVDVTHETGQYVLELGSLVNAANVKASSAADWIAVENANRSNGYRPRAKSVHDRETPTEGMGVSEPLQRPRTPLESLEPIVPDLLEQAEERRAAKSFRRKVRGFLVKTAEKGAREVIARYVIPALLAAALAAWGARECSWRAKVKAAPAPAATSSGEAHQ